jgi:hypothetical protein
MSYLWHSLSRWHSCKRAWSFSKLPTPLFTDFNGTANRETEFAVGTPLIDGDFSKPVRILVPKGRAGRLIAEGPHVL